MTFQGLKFGLVFCPTTALLAVFITVRCNRSAFYLEFMNTFRGFFFIMKKLCYFIFSCKISQLVQFSIFLIGLCFFFLFRAF